MLKQTLYSRFFRIVYSQYFPLSTTDNVLLNTFSGVYVLLPNLSCPDLIQRRRGCSRSDNGALSSFDSWAVNGADFVTFDPKTLQWKAMSQTAREIASRWNGRQIRNLMFRDFVDIDCPKLIKSFELKHIDQKTGARQ